MPNLPSLKRRTTINQKCLKFARSLSSDTDELRYAMKAFCQQVQLLCDENDAEAQHQAGRRDLEREGRDGVSMEEEDKPRSSKLRLVSDRLPTMPV